VCERARVCECVRARETVQMQNHCVVGIRESVCTRERERERVPYPLTNCILICPCTTQTSGSEAATVPPAGHCARPQTPDGPARLVVSRLGCFGRGRERHRRGVQLWLKLPGRSEPLTVLRKKPSNFGSDRSSRLCRPLGEPAPWP